MRRSKQPKRSPLPPTTTHGRMMGLDLSLTGTGVAIVESETMQIVTTKRLGSKERGTKRLTEIRDAIVALAREHEVRETAVEYFGINRHRGVVHTVWLHGLVVVGLVEAGFGAPLYISPSTLKKITSGNGRAEKTDMRDAIAAAAGVTIEDDNIVDAIALARCMSKWHLWCKGDYHPTSYEAQAFNSFERAIQR